MDSTELEPLRERIEHVVVLMLENRSFDHLLGYLRHPNEDEYESLNPSGQFSNLEDPGDARSPRWLAVPEGRRHTPLDPAHSHDAVMLQLGLAPSGLEQNSGFVASYLEKAGAARVVQARKVGLELAAVMMGCLPESLSPGISRLAKEFAICRRWFSSVPGETWPNRNFAHAATSDHTVNIELGVYSDPTVFEQLDQFSAERHPWRIYHEGPAQVMAFRKLWNDDRMEDHFFELRSFVEHVAAGNLPRYSFLEPNHNTPGARLLYPRSNSQHPNNNRVPLERYAGDDASSGADFRRGDALVCEIYEALRKKPALFEKTLFLITYDEHGGWYDHVAPPAVVPPGDRLDRGFLRSLIGKFVRPGRHTFDFGRLGARVPAIAVSPWIAPATLDHTEYDHSSIPRTVRELFAPSAPPLSARDAAARSFAHLVGGLGAPRRARTFPASRTASRRVPAWLTLPPRTTRSSCLPTNSNDPLTPWCSSSQKTWGSPSRRSSTSPSFQPGCGTRRCFPAHWPKKQRRRSGRSRPGPVSAERRQPELSGSKMRHV